MAHAGLTRLRARSCVHDSEGPRQRARSFCFAARTRSDAKMLRDGFDTGAQSTLGSRRAEYRLQGDDRPLQRHSVVCASLILETETNCENSLGGNFPKARCLFSVVGIFTVGYSK